MIHALIVDDDTDILTSIKTLAADSGYSVVTATNWDDGLAKFILLFPDLVIADYNLPGSRHGLQLLFEACKLRPSTRLVLMSAYLNTEDLERVESLELVDAAFRKTNPMETGRAILRELRDAGVRAEAPVDWTAVAAATLSGQRVDIAALDALDGYLRTERLSETGNGETR